MNPFLELDARDVLSVTRALIDCESVSKHEENLCDNLQEWLGSLRPDATLTRLQNNLIVQVNHGTGKKPILLAGHIDTVPPAEFEGASNHKSRIVDDTLYGLGSADMKSGVAVMIALLADIKISSTFVFYECEEIAEEFNGLRYIVNNSPELLEASWAILLEPTDSQLEMGCQGSLTAKARFVGKRAHSARPWMGINAIHKASKVLARAVEESEAQPKVEIEGLTYTPALQVTLIEGGVAANVIPDSSVVTVNHRFAPDTSPEKAQAYVVDQVCAGADEVSITSIAGGAMPAMDHPLVAFARENGRQLVPKIGWTDVARFYWLDIPAVNCGPGDALLCHRADEHIKIEKLNETFEFLHDFIATIE